jgi:hypothetical protein
MEEQANQVMDETEDCGESRSHDEAGLATAELLGNAALGVLALVAIWALMQQLGVDIVEWIRGQLIG